MISTTTGKTQPLQNRSRAVSSSSSLTTPGRAPQDEPSADKSPARSRHVQNRSVAGQDQRQNQRPSDSTAPIELIRLIEASLQAARTTRLAHQLAGDPDFSAWLLQLAELHESSVVELQQVRNGGPYDTHRRFSFTCWLRRCLMRCTRILPETADFVLIDLCRREEFQVQTAYEHALWQLTAGEIRDVVEDQFQQFVLHRSMIPTRRLPQTRQFLEQADRLQRIHSPAHDEEQS